MIILYRLELIFTKSKIVFVFLQYGEDLDVKTADYDYPEKDFEGHGDPDKMFENT